MANLILISLFALPMIIVIFLLVALCCLIIDTIETNKINFYENIEVVEISKEEYLVNTEEDEE